MSADWSTLPADLLGVIFEKVANGDVNHLSDCAGVCLSWQSVTDQLINWTPNEAEKKSMVTDQLVNWTPNEAEKKSMVTDQLVNLIPNPSPDEATIFRVEPVSLLHSTWSNIHTDPLCLIFERVGDTNVDNLSNCAGACVSWRSLRAQLVNKFSPIILLADREAKRDEKGHWVLYPLPNQGTYCLFDTTTKEMEEMVLMELLGKQFSSLCPGWLLTTDRHSQQLGVINPFVGDQMTLPLPWCFKTDITFNVVPSSNPSDKNCIFFGSYSTCDPLKGFCRAGDNEWIINRSYIGGGWGILDAIYSKGYFYLVDRNLHLYSIEVTDHTSLTTTIRKLLPLPKLGKNLDSEYFLVEVMGQILLITKYQTKLGIVVHMLQHNGELKSWIQLGSLGGKHAVYLDHFRSLSIFVGESNHRANSIYYIEDRVVSSVVCSFNMETGSFEEIGAFLLTNPASWFKFPVTTRI